VNELQPNNIAVKKVIYKNISQPQKIKLSIVLPFYKKLDICSNLIDSIYNKSLYIDFEIIAVSDDTANLGTEQFFSNIPRAKYFCTQKNKGFGHAVNLGLEKANNELVCIMHSDTVVTEQKMFANLVNDLLSLKNQGVVTVSATTNNFMSKEFVSYQQNESADLDPVIIQRPSPFICTMGYKTILLKAGGFPEYPFCWFEGDMMGARLAKLGYKQAISKRAFVKHLGGATVLDLIKNNSSAKTTIAENFKLYKRDLEILV
jgi:GT2 family glycosyltransferase